jgi:protein phosphatase
VELWSLTDTGKCREQNEDCVILLPGTGAVLADGMGGANAGEIASQIAVHTIRDALEFALKGEGSTVSTNDVINLVRQSIEKANTAIIEAAARNPVYAGMGTTVVLALVHSNRLIAAHVGDSRLYRLRNNTLKPLTKDHSLVQQWIDQGIVSVEEARHSPYRSILTRALGVESSVHPDIHADSVRKGDIYLLCSDGLHNVVPDQRIQSVLQSGDNSLQAMAAALIRMANDAGGPDNVTVALIRI